VGEKRTVVAGCASKDALVEPYCECVHGSHHQEECASLFRLLGRDPERSEAPTQPNRKRKRPGER
jgi:hypothetical protein